MLNRIINFSLKQKLPVFLLTLAIIGFGSYSLMQIPIGAVPDITNNQVQVITTSRNLATQDVERFLTYPVELEMANLPGVTEIRSVSKFGLSVVTVVFDDEIGTYLPRQLIAEKIKLAEEKIPEGFGKPFMGPVTTGLGEIYQYVIDVDEKYRGDYSITELRTIQDWIVKRQLSGIPGVVEVNTWGGYLKQYEVAVNPERLRSMNISVADVYEAVERNNGVAGGSYIEKGEESFFIRGEGLIKSIEEIEKIVVTLRGEVPVLIRDVATVGTGHANRFGAITGNGEGEKVLGQVMMLKGGNSKEVIEAVKKRVEEISSSLPEGVRINPVLERSELIERTTFTIFENLILGFLIVLFVVVLLLGNWRSGLVVASVIPLCLLFALSLMNIFNVDANLMSLGAIDFGIIIDGAVIIVEYVAFRITSEKSMLAGLSGGERQKYMDEVTEKSTSKMMRSAVFGQLIIIIVFIPILSLANVEGKMFRPMAQVFIFALIGAMILCFTYVPVLSSLVLKPTNENKKSLSKRLMEKLQELYLPAINWALRKKAVVLSTAGVILLSTILLFNSMGGEFIPTLDEGDFVIQPVLKTGTSLKRTIAYTTRMEKILKSFPEVEQVVTRIGAAEVPTDPMSMEESDVIIKLIPKSEWVSAKSKDELADLFKEALSEIPGVEYEFTQPIEMRFNELITGVRADLAIKIFGEDLDLLYSKALEIQGAIREVKGAADITVEKITGLPQMTVKYDRDKIARYGLNIDELNQIITAGFAGISAGTIFEGEKQFDLVVRYDTTHRKSIRDLEMASVLLKNGNRLPLKEFASISYTKGPARISRDNTKRRVVVGVNVRNRDLESVVKDVQSIVENTIELPVGYSVSYGGQFENLRTARERLLIAVPIALLLIFILLFFAFNSVKDALLVYSAIPLSAVGGVVLLYLRDMPFSISAGVGFIALFGIAVLNGIVLIEHFKELKQQGFSDVAELVITGTQQRLRPVLLTATAAALGFLPMAISTSAGAEVQRPLATVVIGGLISATFLTLIVLPVIYSIFDKKRLKMPKNTPKTLIIALLCTFSVQNLQSQTAAISLQDAIQIARENNKGLEASSSRVDKNKALIGTSFNINKTEVYYHFDENNIAQNNLPLKVWGVNQTFSFPTVYSARRKVQLGRYNLSGSQYQIDQHLLDKNVSLAYVEVAYRMNVRDELSMLDSLFGIFMKAAELRYKQGDITYLEQLSAEARRNQIGLDLEQGKQDLSKAKNKLLRFMQSDSSYKVDVSSFTILELVPIDSSTHPGLKYYDQSIQLSQRMKTLQKQQFLPNLQLSYFQGNNNGLDNKVYRGFQAGVAIPLWFSADKAGLKAATADLKATELEREEYRIELSSHRAAMMSELEKYRAAIDYFNQSGNNQSKQLLHHAAIAFDSGEIDYLQYVQLIEQAKNIQINYLESVWKYNQVVLDLNYMIK